jgi:hypothetical protein
MTITGAAPTCSLQITSQTLSTWRADGLPTREASALAAHVGECASCQAHLAAYDKMDALLRAQTLPQGLTGNWEPLRVRLHVRSPRRLRSLRLPANAHLIAAVAAMLLVVIGFTLVFRTGIGQRISAAGTMTAIPTATPEPGPTIVEPTATPFNYGQPAHPLTWRQVALPADLSPLAELNFTGPNDANLTNLVVAPSDGSILYLWGPNTTATRDTQGNVRYWSLWVSRAAGAHWSHATPPVTSDSTGHLTVDTLNPNLLLAEAYSYDPPGWEHVTDRYISRDGGVSWQARTFAGKSIVRRMVTLGATTIASVGDQRDPNGGALAEGDIPFTRSDDGMRTWRAIDQPIVATGQWVTGFWVNPRTGTILARTNQRWLWESYDLGAYWTRLPEAGPPNSYVQYIVQETLASDRWHICAFINDGSSDIPSLQCTEDSGKTWVNRADISIGIPCPVCAKGNPGPLIGIPTPIGIAADGSVLVADLGGMTSDYQGLFAFYRLEPASARWQSLGLVPGSGSPSQRLYQGRVMWVAGVTGAYVATYQ